MLKILAFLTKREDIETRAFIEYYENHHVPLICSLAPAPIVYKRNYLVRGDELNSQEDDTNGSCQHQAPLPQWWSRTAGHRTVTAVRPAHRHARTGRSARALA
jgi:hypothetical protein